MSNHVTRVLVTGAQGFIGKNLLVRLRELPRFTVTEFLRGDNSASLVELMTQVDAVVHLAGENRPDDERAFATINTGLTETICAAIQQSNRQIPLIFASSTQAERDNAYGQSKLAAEHAIRALGKSTGNPAVIFRLPGIFGKWCRPNYNSVVATFCHNIARGLPIQIHDPSAALRLAYVDDVLSAFIAAFDQPPSTVVEGVVAPEYSITLGDLANQIKAFDECRSSLLTERVGTGLIRALYATYISYLPNERFVYTVPQYKDPRGVFVEMLKTPDCGQFSYFTAGVGVTRGGHYHHSKTEKFLVIKGRALFRFRHLITNECFELTTSGAETQIVDTIPGWAHDITNIGEDEMIVMLWANEIFDRKNPDTIGSRV
jgi:UDP-2-acetamido-2,6-beta-L-arabino-hexul-4-ose reductase